MEGALFFASVGVVTERHRSVEMANRNNHKATTTMTPLFVHLGIVMTIAAVLLIMRGVVVVGGLPLQRAGGEIEWHHC